MPYFIKKGMICEQKAAQRIISAFYGESIPVPKMVQSGRGHGPLRG